MYTPFLKEQKVPEINGIYRNKVSGKLSLFKNVWIKGMIDCPEGKPERPFDGYQGTWQFEGEAVIRKCVIEVDELINHYDKIFSI
jgi:hypothetical protein